MGSEMCIRDSKTTEHAEEEAITVLSSTTDVNTDRGDDASTKEASSSVAALLKAANRKHNAMASKSLKKLASKPPTLRFGASKAEMEAHEKVYAAWLSEKIAKEEETRKKAKNLSSGDSSEGNERGGSKIPRGVKRVQHPVCLLYTSPSPRDGLLSRMPSSA